MKICKARCCGGVASVTVLGVYCMEMVTVVVYYYDGVGVSSE